MSGSAGNHPDRAEAAARWLLSLPPETSAAVVERLSRETLQGIREALHRLGEADAAAEVPGRRSIDPERLDEEPPFLLAAVLAATPAGDRDGVRAAIAERRGDDVLASIDGFGTLSPTPQAAAILRSHLEGRS